jgi:hypothetical protein
VLIRGVLSGGMPCGRLAGYDQPLNGMNLIGKAALNILEPGGRRGGSRAPSLAPKR